MSNKYTMRINLNVLNHLGINLYSSTPAVLSEVIANAWDAGASNVWIETENNTIAISDDGQGMNLSDINKRFLLVGYSKREDSDAFVPSDRQIMGRKGIGKLSLFSIANIIDVYSVKEGEKNGFQLNVNKIREIIKSGNNTPYHPEQKKSGRNPEGY